MRFFLFLPLMLTSAQQKSALRKVMQAKRDALPTSQREAWSALITEKLLRHPRFHAARCVLAYASIRSEFNTDAFIDVCLRAGKMLVLPVAIDQHLQLRRVTDVRSLTKGAFGIAEPPARAPEVLLDQIDFALLPGLAFDCTLNRLGYGGGYYDRLLAIQHPYLVSAAFSIQLMDDVPVDEHDVKLDLLITELQQFESRHER